MVETGRQRRGPHRRPDTSNIYSKILRFNLDGSVPPDDPFLDVAGAVPYIYAYGSADPLRFTFLQAARP